MRIASITPTIGGGYTIQNYKCAHATGSGKMSGLSSERGTPVSFSIDNTNSAGTPRFERVSQYQTCDWVVPIRSASGFWPPAISQARRRASVDMPGDYLGFGNNQPKCLFGTGNLRFGRIFHMGDIHQPLREIDPIAFGGRVRARRKKLKLSAKALGGKLGMSQQGIHSIEKGKSKRPGMSFELAKALGTSLEWLRWGEGDEEVVDQDKLNRDYAKAVVDKMSPAEVADFVRRAKGNAA